MTYDMTQIAAPPAEEWITCAEYAARHRIPRSTVSMWAIRGELGSRRREGRRYYIRADATWVSMAAERRAARGAERARARIEWGLPSRSELQSMRAEGWVLSRIWADQQQIRHETARGWMRLGLLGELRLGAHGNRYVRIDAPCPPGGRGSGARIPRTPHVVPVVSGAPVERRPRVYVAPPSGSSTTWYQNLRDPHVAAAKALADLVYESHRPWRPEPTLAGERWSRYGGWMGGVR